MFATFIPRLFWRVTSYMAYQAVFVRFTMAEAENQSVPRGQPFTVGGSPGRWPSRYWK